MIKKITDMGQKLDFSETSVLTVEVANDVTDKAITQVAQNFVKNSSYICQQKDSNLNIFLDTKPCKERPYNSNLVPKKSIQMEKI